ncbi:hypothetical protein PQS90_13915 [Pseudomonas sp. BLCC-B13]|uniref:hypothetical protein n=1 Tax=Pseudomonas sp. BLCC-B13 TaxID=3025314 RepID=UPI00234E42F2|nr:hypothetical protein [Pseudomonas sp. BLCC-B13]MDC7826248.1 hypothetical protein [Pseudomonas sp. BLCC-B13]
MRFLWLLLALFAFHAQAADYKWAVRGSAVASQHFTDWKEACTEASKVVGGPWPTIGISPVANSTDKIVYCLYQRPQYPNGYYCSLDCYVTRVGDTCPTGTTWNPTSRKCEGDPCLPTVGQVIYHGHTFRNLGADGNPDTDPPIAICSNACQYTHTFEAFGSKRKGDEIEGSFKYKGNGVSCTVSSSNPSNFDQPPTKPPMSPQQEYFSDKSCDNWVTNADGTSSRRCVSTNKYREPGKLNCKYGAGAMVCNVATPSPNGKETTVTETTDVTLNPDGSKNTTTNTSTTTTTCKGLSKCSTTTKNETKNEGTNPDGSPGDTETECTGDGCVPEEEDGEDKGEEEEEQEEEGIPGPSRSLAKGEQGNFNDANSEWDQKIETAETTLQQKVDQYADAFSGVFDLNLGSGGGSLPCEQVPVTIGTTTQNLDMCLERFSEPLSYLRFAILLAATALAALIILG